MDIKYVIEELLNENADDLTISKALRNSINEYFKKLDQLFDKTQGKDFLVKHTRYIDSIITAIYKVAVRKMFGIYSPLSNAIPITVIALGSYGREQLAPYSDIDLLILYEETEGYNTKALIEKILYIIWDTKLKLGHRVHELKEIQEIAKSDDTIKTALLESRFLIGSKYLWFKYENELAKVRQYNQKEYILAKIEEAKKRRHKYPFAMEPHIKEGVGSLRDANLVYWIANVIYGITSLKNLIGTLFNEEEYKEYRIALEWLFRIRAALHLVAKKKEDRLLLQYIPDVATKLDVKGTTPQKKQQNLVTKTLQAMHTIDTFSQIYTKKMIRRYLFNALNIPKLHSGRVKERLFICEEMAFASYFVQENALKSFLDFLVHNEFKKYDPSLVHYAKKVKSPKQLAKTTAKTIKKLYYKNSLYPVLCLLHKSNLLANVVPPLKKVMFMPQFDGYHKYPVDIHSLMCIKALEEIDDPHLQNLWNNLNDEEKALLKLVILLHDSGKGRRQRHHDVGAKLFKTYAQKLGFSSDLIETGAILIKHHTDMTDNAYNKDFHNEKVLLAFVAPLKNKKRLDMLYLLTYADVNGVGNNVYTSYNAKLLKELYTLALESLQRSEILDEVSKRLKKENALKKNAAFLALPRMLQKRILSIESNLFFIKHKTEEIIEISKIAYETDDYTYKIKNDDFLRIEIIRTTPINLGYLLGKLSYLDIVSMEVFKLFDNKKFFRIEFMEKDEENIDFITHVIEDSFDMSKKIRLKRPIIEKSGIKIDCNHSKTYAMMSIEAPNQKGLLAYIAKVFDEFGIDIATAKIHTIKKRAKDLFLIEKNGNFCTRTEEILKKLLGE
ncbi:nucleotidyltransferase domain-containing protein [Nitratiruptor tergarcus]|uniref:Bifunctional uridylyltransferase/uridylyl-removing enzyme n=1 Tax=Nitratiruptor tergarcus DSM 16512 TaxID=1069081 RepID=A0A1W1WSL6_9BACT|nr:nucleotidyltransferase domain-containing protein [Nitratiruptor tergarcus]SMC09318.1 [protein-PII] uridylyltransferase [Nitratiruptor tergarcus DSM 16512]